jgi:hypothetical protein
MFAQMPKVIEIGRLQRLKQAALGAEIRQPKAGIVATDDWLADLDARIADLERGLHLELGERRVSGNRFPCGESDTGLWPEVGYRSTQRYRR